MTALEEWLPTTVERSQVLDPTSPERTETTVQQEDQGKIILTRGGIPRYESKQEVGARPRGPRVLTRRKQSGTGMHRADSARCPHWANITCIWRYWMILQNLWKRRMHNVRCTAPQDAMGYQCGRSITLMGRI